MVRSRQRLSGRCSGGSSDPFFSHLCELCFSALSSLRSRFYFPVPTICHRGRSEGSAFPGSSLATRLRRVSRGHSSVATIPFKIISFADPHPLTPIESNLYKKQGRGWGPQDLPFFFPVDKCVTHSNARNPSLFMRLLHGSLHTPGVGACLFPPRGSAHSASLRYPFPLLASPLRVNAGAPNEP